MILSLSDGSRWPQASQRIPEWPTGRQFCFEHCPDRAKPCHAWLRAAFAGRRRVLGEAPALQAGRGRRWRRAGSGGVKKGVNFSYPFDTASNRLTLAIILAASIIGSSLIMQTQMPPLLMGYPLFGMLGFVVSGVLGLGLVIAILRSGGF